MKKIEQSITYQVKLIITKASFEITGKNYCDVIKN